MLQQAYDRLSHHSLFIGDSSDKKYIEDILEGTKIRTNDLNNLCSYVLMNSPNIDKVCKKKAELIINKVKDFLPARSR